MAVKQMKDNKHLEMIYLPSDIFKIDGDEINHIRIKEKIPVK